MKAPVIFVVFRRDNHEMVSWSFDEREAADEADRLNGGDEWGNHGFETVEPIGGKSKGFS